MTYGVNILFDHLRTRNFYQIFNVSEIISLRNGFVKLRYCPNIEIINSEDMNVFIVKEKNYCIDRGLTISTNFLQGRMSAQRRRRSACIATHIQNRIHYKKKKKKKKKRKKNKPIQIY